MKLLLTFARNPIEIAYNGAFIFSTFANIEDCCMIYDCTPLLRMTNPNPCCNNDVYNYGYSRIRDTFFTKEDIFIFCNDNQDRYTIIEDLKRRLLKWTRNI